MPICVEEKELCTGCGMCSNLCPKGCIVMKEDAEGFWYPQVNTSKCIECELCITRCPILGRNLRINSGTPIVYAAKTKDSILRFNSTSGGIFSELAKVIFQNGGYVVGAQYRSDNMVEHCLVKEITELERIRQSKYIQSDMGNIYLEIKNELVKGKTVTFCGSPCQVAGLYAFVGKKTENLITLDFICRGMNSPKAYKYWLKELGEKSKSKVIRVWFKYKANGWRNSPKCTRVDFANGKQKMLNGDENTFMRGYLSGNLYIRPSCGACKFKGISRNSDITLADFWGLNSDFDDDKGISMVIVNSEKGKKLFEQIQSNVDMQERPLDEVLKGNAFANNSVMINPDSGAFLRQLECVPFTKLVNRYVKVPLRKQIKDRILRIKGKL